jgi:hypothetical protein
MLCAGISPSRVEQLIAQKHGIKPRRARALRQKVYERWDQQAKADAPYRREKIIRMGERFYAKCVSKEQYTAAAQVFGHLARMSGAFTARDPVRDDRLAELGPPPSDPTQMLVWAQRGMAFALWEVLTHPSIEPERRIRLISDIGAKLGMTHAKALVQHRLAEVAGRVFGGVETPSDALVPVTDAEWYDPPGSGAGDHGGDPPARHGARPPPGEDR